MNGDLLPALAAAGTGGALIGTIWAYEHRRDEQMRASRVRLALRFPAALDPLTAKAVLGSLAGLPHEAELVFEVFADGDGVKFFIFVPQGLRASVESVLSGAMPGLRVSEAPIQTGRATCALRTFIPTPSLLSTENPEAASRTLLSALATLSPEGEAVGVRWAVRPGSAPELRAQEPLDGRARAVQQAWRQKAHLAGGFQVGGMVVVRAERVGRARELAEHVASAIRSRRGAIGGPRITYERGSRSLASLPRTTRTSGWLNTAEVLALFSWPLGDAQLPGVEAGTSRELLTPRSVPTHGRRLFIGRNATGERPVALSPTASLHHMAVVAPTGAGKSNLLMRCILSDLAQGYGGIVLDPKADLIAELIDRVPAEAVDRVVVLDPSRPGPVPGLDLFGEGDPDVRADTVLATFKSIYKDAWGVRIDGFLRLGLRTAVELENPVLSDWIRLYTDAGLRQRAVAKLRDPILVGQWRSYESLSAAQQHEYVAPALSRITSLLARPGLRNIINQRRPLVNLPRLLAEGRWLLVTVSPASGEAASELLSAIVGYLTWTAIEARVTLPPEQRHPIFFYCDELASLRLPVGLQVFLERSRGLGCGVVAATQGLYRLSDTVRSSLLANAGTLISSRTGSEEATRLARELAPLTATDLMALPRFEVAARVGTGLGNTATVVTGRTEGPPPVTGQGAQIRRLSAERYGRDPKEIEAEFVHGFEGEDRDDLGSVGQIRRAR
jgi:Type IV secretion-system coupling protein DNA-binding domain/Helicase HerA, central domain